MEKQNYRLNDLIADVHNLATLISEKISHISFQDYCERGNREVIEINALLIKALLKIRIFEKKDSKCKFTLEIPEEVVSNIEMEYPRDKHRQQRRKQWWWITEGLKNVIFLQN